MISPDGSKAFICDFGITTFARTYAREYYTWHDNSERWDAPELMEPDLACPSPIKPDRKSTRLNSSHSGESRMPSSA